MDINSMTPATGRIIAEDGSIKNVVDILGAGVAPVSDTIHDIDQHSPRSGRVIGEDGKLYNLVDLLQNGGGGGGETTNHANLSNLSYAQSGHTGFASQEALDAEAQARHQEITTAIDEEAADRLQEDTRLNNELTETNRVLSGKVTQTLSGISLNKIINGETAVAKSVLSPTIPLIGGGSWVNDADGTLAIYAGDLNPNTAIFRTKTTSGGGGGAFAFIPDRANRAAVLNTDGTWTATADGFVQRSATITHPSTTFAIFRLYQNDVVAWANEHAGLLSTGLYEFTSETIPVQQGDVIRTESSGNGIVSTLWFIPPRAVPGVEIDDIPTENSQNVVRSGGVFAAIQATKPQVENLHIEVSGNASITIFKDSAVILQGGGLYIFHEDISLSVGNLDADSALVMGTDYYIYICNNGEFWLSRDREYPANFDETNSRKIGGFHYGIERIGTAAPTDIHESIVPRSLWTLFHRPKCDPEGMVYLSGGVWVDIYISSDNGEDGFNSKHGESPMTTITWYAAAERLLAVGKRMLTYQEWVQAAAGSPPGTSSGNQNAWTASSDRAPTGFVANAVSSIGCRDCVGNVWEWMGDIIASGIGTPAWQVPSYGAENGQLWINNANDFRALLAGGSYFNGALVGSRSACVIYSPWESHVSFGVRGACGSL